MLLNYLSTEGLFCMNTQFRKTPHRKWTWKSPNNMVRNEIGYILTSSRQICEDVTVLNRFHAGNDHRLVRAKIRIDTRLERRKLIKRNVYQTEIALRRKRLEYQETIRAKLEPVENLRSMELDKLSERITTSIQVATKKVCTQAKLRSSKLSDETMNLLEERRRTDRDSGRYQTGSFEKRSGGT